MWCCINLAFSTTLPHGDKCCKYKIGDVMCSTKYVCETKNTITFNITGYIYIYWYVVGLLSHSNNQVKGMVMIHEFHIIDIYVHSAFKGESLILETVN